ncbi:MAG TPA: CHAT domain-containing protein [Anaerolineae bacterium]|nr:CHAT domain-containing protein [Anaerolineae bacterium]
MAEYYTFRVRIANRNRVVAEKLDLKGGVEEEVGKFRYDMYGTDIEALSEKGRQGELSAAEVKKLGELLFQVLFDDVVRTRFKDLYEKAVHTEKKVLRLELEIDERELAAVAAWPWEFLRLPSHLNEGTMWLGTTPNIVFSRYRVGRKPDSIILAEGEKLRIALVVAAPSDLGSVEYEKVKFVLDKLMEAEGGTIEFLPVVLSATPKKIDDILRQEPHIFHFIGHGQAKDEGKIALVDDLFGGAMWYGAERFSELFNRHRPGVVMLQACEGGQLDASKAFVGVASRIVQQQIPVVVAMQYEVSNSTAARFAVNFYEHLAQGQPVDKAAQEGRRAIALGPKGYDSIDFGTPVLFMRVDNGQLFRFEQDNKEQWDNGQSGGNGEPMVVSDVEELVPIRFAERFQLKGGIPGGIMRLLRGVLMKYPAFESNHSLRQVFDDSRIKMWQASLPEGRNVGERVDGVISFLHNRENSVGANGLMLFLDILVERVPVGDGLYQEFEGLAAALAAEVGEKNVGGQRGGDGGGINKTALVEELARNFSDEDFRDLCFDLGIEYADIPGAGRRAKMRGLVMQMGYDKKLELLVRKCREMKPRGGWDDFG